MDRLADARQNHPLKKAPLVATPYATTSKTIKMPAAQAISQASRPLAGAPALNCRIRHNILR